MAGDRLRCSRCESPLIAFAVPETYREHAPETAAVAAICSRCLDVSALDRRAGDRDGPDGRTEDEPDFSRLSGAYPSDPESGAVLSLLLGLCSSLATNRPAIETLLDDLERRGVDPLLTIDRLLAEPDVEPAIDLARRRHQLEQLLY